MNEEVTEQITPTQEEWQPTKNPWLISIPLMASVFMYALDETISNVALPYIIKEHPSVRSLSRYPGNGQTPLPEASHERYPARRRGGSETENRRPDLQCQSYP